MNMNKINAILTVWFVAAGTIAVANMFKPIDVGGVVLAIIVLVASVIISALIGVFGNDTAAAAGATAAEKAKRRNRVDALLDMLTDDDLVTLRRRLSDRADEGEPVAIEDVLAEDGELRRRR